MMPGPEALLTVAELALALAGFASLVAVLLSRSLAGWRAFDRTRFRAMLELSLGAALLAFVPTCLFALGTTEPGAARIGDAIRVVARP